MSFKSPLWSFLIELGNILIIYYKVMYLDIAMMNSQILELLNSFEINIYMQ